MSILVSQYAHILYGICVRNSHVAAKLYTTVMRKLMNSNITYSEGSASVLHSNCEAEDN